MKLKYEVHESHISIWDETYWRYAILMGGRGNGRSGTASRFSISHLVSSKYTRGAIMRATREDIRASSWQALNDRLIEREAEKGVHITENDMKMECGRNSLRAFGFRASSGSLTARLKSLEDINYVWIEEAEEIGEAEFRKLDDTLRTVKGKIQIVFTMNTPPKGHWILNKWFDLIPHGEVKRFYIPQVKKDVKDVLFIGGTWRENEPNMDKATVERYQRYKDTIPEYYWQVIEGLSPEEVRGKIYTGWQLIDSIPHEARLVAFGEDYGWFPDPACVVAIYYWNGSYIIDELVYGTELTNEFLAREIKKVDNGRKIKVVADSAEPKSIAEQRRYGINVQPCAKGKDSVSFRIKVTAQKKIYVTRRSTNVWEAYEKYAWEENKDGQPTGKPDHTWSHPMDAVSYPIADMHNKTSDIIAYRPKLPRKKTNIAL